MNHRFQCRCGTVQGEVAQARRGISAVCYCTDCQAYAHVLGEAPRVLDALGGTEVVAVPASDVRITAGAQALACLSLSPRGLLRWYAGCCNTPIANTPRNWKLPYVGMVHTCLDQPTPLRATWPTVRLRANTQSAHGTPPASGPGGWLGLAGLAARMAGVRLAGRYRRTPFFGAGGTPAVAVRVVPREQVEAARRAGSAA